MTRRSDPKAAPTVAAAKRDQSQFTHQDLTKDLFGEYTKPEIDIRYQVYSNGAEPLNDCEPLRDIGRKVSPRDREKVLALFEKAHTRQAAAVEHNGAFPDLGKAHRTSAGKRAGGPDRGRGRCAGEGRARSRWRWVHHAAASVLLLRHRHLSTPRESARRLLSVPPHNSKRRSSSVGPSMTACQRAGSSRSRFGSAGKLNDSL